MLDFSLSVLRKNYLGILLSILIWAFLLTNLNASPFGETRPTPKDFSCYDIFRNPFINDVPHPTNYSLFIKCAEETPGRPVPNIFECPDMLLFDFEISCNCEWPALARCFDVNNLEHVANMFKCACPLKKNAEGVLVPDLEDERCNNGVQRRKKYEKKLRNPS